MSNENGNGRVPGQPNRMTDNEVNADRFEDLLYNAMLTRSDLFRALMDPRRDLNDECGYPRGWVSPHALQELNDFDPVASRVNEAYAKACWQAQPTVYESKKAKDTRTAFEEAWDGLGENLQRDTPKSWFKSERGNPVWECLLRADVLSGVGYYGVVFLGLDDNRPLSEPATPRSGQKLVQLKAYPHWQCEIGQWDNDPNSPRRGKPVSYNIQGFDPKVQPTGIGADLNSVEVHWTRVIHLADTHHHAVGNDVFAMPRTRPVWNDIYNLQKIAGAGGEGYWKTAFMGLSLETTPQLGASVRVNQSALKDMMEQYQNGLQRYLALVGMQAKTLAPQIIDPTPFVDQCVRRICIKIKVPKRKFEGSERGELASSQDDGEWNDMLMERNVNYTTPKVIVPFVDRLIWLGVLPEPKEYFVEWPDLTKKTETEKADVAAKITQALTAYVQGGVEAVVPPQDYLTRVLGWDEDEAKETLEAAAKLMEEQMAGEGAGSPLLSMVGGLTGVTELFKAAKDGAMSEETLKQMLMMFFKIDEATADAIIADGLPEDPEPEPELPLPMKVRKADGGEKLVDPRTVVKPPPKKESTE